MEKDQPVDGWCAMFRSYNAAIVTGVILLACSSAVAQSPTDSDTIEVFGNIVGGSCTITTAPVDLGAHDASEFTGVGTPPQSGWVDFPITSTGCSADIVSLHMGFNGTADLNNSGLFAVASGGASGIGVQLQFRDGSSTVIPNSTTALLDWIPGADGAIYPMRARYLQTLGSVTPGAANSTVTVMLFYN